MPLGSLIDKEDLGPFTGGAFKSELWSGLPYSSTLLGGARTLQVNSRGPTTRLALHVVTIFSVLNAQIVSACAAVFAGGVRAAGQDPRQAIAGWLSPSA